MEHLLTSRDHDYVREVAACLKSRGVDVHIGNAGTSSLHGSGSYQQSIFILDKAQVSRAYEIMKTREAAPGTSGKTAEPAFLLFIGKLFVNKLFLVAVAILVTVLLILQDK